MLSDRGNSNLNVKITYEKINSSVEKKEAKSGPTLLRFALIMLSPKTHT